MPSPREGLGPTKASVAGFPRTVIIRRDNRRKEAAVRDLKMLVVVAGALFATALSHVGMGQDKATAREGVAKVRQAARTLSRTRGLTRFTQKQGRWVWRDSYSFVAARDK